MLAGGLGYLPHGPLLRADYDIENYFPQGDQSKRRKENENVGAGGKKWKSRADK